MIRIITSPNNSMGMSARRSPQPDAPKWTRRPTTLQLAISLENNGRQIRTGTSKRIRSQACSQGIPANIPSGTLGDLTYEVAVMSCRRPIADVSNFS